MSGISARQASRCGAVGGVAACGTMPAFRLANISGRIVPRNSTTVAATSTHVSRASVRVNASSRTALFADYVAATVSSERNTSSRPPLSASRRLRPIDAQNRLNNRNVRHPLSGIERVGLRPSRRTHQRNRLPHFHEFSHPSGRRPPLQPAGEGKARRNRRTCRNAAIMESRSLRAREHRP